MSRDLIMRAARSAMASTVAVVSADTIAGIIEADGVTTPLVRRWASFLTRLDGWPSVGSRRWPPQRGERRCAQTTHRHTDTSGSANSSVGLGQFLGAVAAGRRGEGEQGSGLVDVEDALSNKRFPSVAAGSAYRGHARLSRYGCPMPAAPRRSPTFYAAERCRPYCKNLTSCSFGYFGWDWTSNSRTTMTLRALQRAV